MECIYSYIFLPDIEAIAHNDFVLFVQDYVLLLFNDDVNMPELPSLLTNWKGTVISSRNILDKFVSKMRTKVYSLNI